MAATYAGQWGPEALLTVAGALVLNTAYTVMLAGTSTLATLYTDRTKATGAGNPGQSTDAKGNAKFFADPGLYDIQIASVVVLAGVVVLPDRGSMQRRFALDVRDYGALLDGTTDDTAAINAALGDLPTRGGKVLIAGTPKISGPLVYAQHGTVISGNGDYNSSLIMNSTTADYIQNDGFVECGVEHLQFEPAAGVVRTAGSAIHATGTTDCFYDNLRFQDTWNAMNLLDCGTTYLERLRLVDSGLGATNRGVLLLGCVSTQMSNWIFNAGAAALNTFNAFLRIDSSCDSPYGMNLLMQASSGAGIGLYLASSQTVSQGAKSGTASIAANGRVLTVSGFTFAAPTATSHGDMGRGISVTGSGLPAVVRIGRVIDSTHAMLTYPATTTVSGAACSIADVGTYDFAPRWVEMLNLAVEGSHNLGPTTDSYANARDGVVIDDVSGFKWTGGQSASGRTGMTYNKGKAVAVNDVRFINNDRDGIAMGAAANDLRTMDCAFSDNSAGQYSGVSQHNIWSGVTLSSGNVYTSAFDYFGDYLVGNARKMKYGINNVAGSICRAPTQPRWGNLGTDTIANKAALTYDWFGLTGVDVARAATPTTLAQVITILQNAGLSL